MFSIFFPTPPPQSFKPVLPSHPPSKPFASMNRKLQSQSPWFTTLAPEIRNLIYTYVFSYPSHETLAYPDLTPHPLSLLLTCHRIYTEASQLAFSRWPFAVNPRDTSTFLVFKIRISHLPPSRTQTIRVISVSMPRCYTYTNITTFESAMALLPALSRFELRCSRDEKLWHTGTYATEWLQFAGSERRDERIERFSPHWFAEGVVRECWKSKGLTWDSAAQLTHDGAEKRHKVKENKRQDWSIEWPQWDPRYAAYHDLLIDIDEYGKERFIPEIAPEAVGNVPGVHTCPCGCGNIIFTTAVFQHRITNRRVIIEAIFHGKPAIYLPLDAESLTRRMCGGNMHVVLRPGGPSLNLVPGDAGYGWDASEAWWEERRRNNGDWGAWARFAWNRLPGPGVLLGRREGKMEDIPGSLVLGQGDWARIDRT